MISWRDIIVWLNALSEMEGLEPVYRTSAGIVIKDARDSNGAQVDGALQTNHNGYRLPTHNEWEMAARWIDGQNWMAEFCFDQLQEEEDQLHFLKGGGWEGGVEYHQVGRSHAHTTHFAYYGFGFRMAKTP